MRRIFSLFLVLITIFGLTVTLAGADPYPGTQLYDRGLDVLGNRLVYDMDLDITWYDFTQGPESHGAAWAYNLTVTMADGRSFTDWRLPTTPGTIAAYINEGEMGHLYYDELGNKAANQPGGGLMNTGPFTNLQIDNNAYWTGTIFQTPSPGPRLAWNFNFTTGAQSAATMFSPLYSLAVHPGDIAANPVPEPSTMLLLGSGLIGLLGFRKKFKK